MKKLTLAQKLERLKFESYTDGKGLWSREARLVKVTGVSIRCSGEYVYMDASFTKSSWNVDKYGLIYTDPGWLTCFRSALVEMGFSVKASRDVDYTEQGMQGQDYVSLEAGKPFTNELFSK